MLAIPKANEKLAELGDNDRPQRTDSRVPGLQLDYPTHPFPPDLCHDISNLPEGFRELALSLRLSREVIRLVIAASRQAFPEAWEVHQSRPWICCPSMVLMYSRKYLGQSSRVTERLVSLSVLISCMRSVSFAFGAEELPLLEQLASLAAQRGFEESSTDQDHHYVWTVIMTAEACRRGSLSSVADQLVCDLLESKARNDMTAPGLLGNWTRLEGVLKRYLWRQDLLDEWRNVWVTTLGNPPPGERGKS
ncbi:uncharacterized protein A1O5_05995 [Cladophialophora psammophila CBS 110553]|uniref:Transcription factor domain-containing protein n=1 Tax=Cladophialophora psammophila CBS 110553 TaxID=1182543 RepID=W9WS31_9EURO|nr:uncharacterized protein A1O5_05995 [Cladophialophora psammophila CBS 110553]EXJ71002.1 hypothetical protein A1O5_05995 [Cladophialophora psammophila CBS 110553]